MRRVRVFYVTGEPGSTIEIAVLERDLEDASPDELDGVLEIIGQSDWDPLARWSLSRYAVAMAPRLTEATGRVWAQGTSFASTVARGSIGACQRRAWSPVSAPGASSP
jgi:hypothetical protein